MFDPVKQCHIIRLIIY